MFVGAIKIELFFPECHSLKEKRQILNSILGKVQAKFNVSVSEIDHHDLWQRATIGIAYVSKSSYQARKALHKVQSYIEGLNKAEVIEDKISFFSPE
jgi:uncharacterized protein YlxP (DUF503 family)